MIKYIWLGIYIYGWILRGIDVYKYRFAYKRFFEPGRRIEILGYIISTIIWPLYWMHNFITYYLDPREDYKG